MENVIFAKKMRMKKYDLLIIPILMLILIGCKGSEKEKIGAKIQRDATYKYIPTKENLEARQDFDSFRFGIFLHWGIYSEFAQGE